MSSHHPEVAYEFFHAFEDVSESQIIPPICPLLRRIKKSCLVDFLWARMKTPPGVGSWAWTGV
jgi:hypothetical protein